MIYPLAKKALFSLEPETAHEFTLRMLRQAEKFGVLSALTPSNLDCPVECMGLKFRNPVGLAAGMDKEGNTIDAFGRLGFGFVEVGTLTPKPQAGNPAPRMFRLPEHDALINRMGFNNPGILEGVANIRQSMSFEGIIGLNIGKNKVTPNEEAIEDYLICLREGYNAADYITVNLSSPNTPGLRDLQNEEETKKLLGTLRAEQSKLASEYGKHVPIALKVAPDLADEHIEALAKVFLEEGLEGLIATNTTIEREAIKGHRYAHEAGGLSGKPETALSTEVIRKFYSALGKEIPIIGVGGIMTGDDAVEKVKAGARLVQLYTGFVYRGPDLIKESVEALAPLYTV